MKIKNVEGMQGFLQEKSICQKTNKQEKNSTKEVLVQNVGAVLFGNQKQKVKLIRNGLAYFYYPKWEKFKEH